MVRPPLLQTSHVDNRSLVEMKREESLRYIEAKKNAEFLETFVKPKSLGPEHTENQLRLRKAVKVVVLSEFPSHTDVGLASNRSRERA